MKSVLQACFLLTVAFGNLIVIIVAEAKAFDQASEFFMFGCLMMVDMAIFAYMAYRYKYVNLSREEAEDFFDTNAENRRHSDDYNHNEMKMEERELQWKSLLFLLTTQK